MMTLDPRNLDDAEPAVTDHSVDIVRTAAAHGVDVQVIDRRIGPTVTVYRLHPGRGVTPRKVESLVQPWTLAVGVPVRYAGIRGTALELEVPNDRRAPVQLVEVLDPDELEEGDDLFVPFGLDAAGNPVTRELCRLPHLLIAGATGMGKSVYLNVVLTSLLSQRGPAGLHLVLVDPKQVELARYAALPHLALPVATTPDEAREALVYAIDVMEDRYGRMRDRGILMTDEAPLVVVVDEIADLMLSAKKTIEPLLAKLLAKGRAAGVHLILATQRPSVDVITGTLKANIPSRIAFSVASMTDSRVILDANGAEQLTGNGDALLSLAGVMGMTRVQAPMVTDDEVVRMVASHVIEQREAVRDEPAPTDNTQLEAFMDSREAVQARAERDVAEARAVLATVPPPVPPRLSLQDQLQAELLEESRARKAKHAERIEYLERALSIVCEALVAHGITLPDIPKED